MGTKPQDESSISSHSVESEQGVLEAISDMFYFIFGGSFLGIVLVLVGIQLHGTGQNILLLLGGIWLGWFAFGDRNTFVAVLLALLALVSIIGAEYAIRGVATLATGGVYGPDNSGTGGYFYASNYVLFLILWALLGVPYRAFKYKLDQNGEGNAQSVMVGTLATIASLLTAVFIILLHYGNGPFSRIQVRPLMVGTIFTVFLVFLIFRSLAKACWQRGILGILSPRPLIMRWGQAAAELGAATSEYYRRLYEFDSTADEVGQKKANPRANSINRAPKANAASPERGDSEGAKRTEGITDVRRVAPAPNKSLMRNSPPRKRPRQRRKRARRRS
jgi:hypothetical protein